MFNCVSTLAVTQDQIGLWLTGAAVLLVFGSLVVGIPILMIRQFRGVREEPPWAKLLLRAQARVGDSMLPEPVVTLTFHTYSGLWHHFVQTEHRQELPAKIALEYLWALHKYNLVHCLVPYHGALFVPFLSWAEYRKQKRLIEDVSAGIR
jgi:hypothetical protein